MFWLNFFQKMYQGAFIIYSRMGPLGVGPNGGWVGGKDLSAKLLTPPFLAFNLHTPTPYGQLKDYSPHSLTRPKISQSF